MGKPKAPKMPDMPDPSEMIREQAEVNRTNQNNPFGSATWNGNTLTQAMSPELQALFGGAMDQLGQGPAQFDYQTPQGFANAQASGLNSLMGGLFGQAYDPYQFLQPPGQGGNDAGTVGRTEQNFFSPQDFALQMGQRPQFAPIDMAQIREQAQAQAQAQQPRPQGGRAVYPEQPTYDPRTGRYGGQIY